MSHLTLAYDDLPAGSDILRVYDGESLQITVPAGEPPAAVMRQAAYDALASGAASSWPLLLLAGVIFYVGIRSNRISGAALTWAWMFFALFCAALVMLVCWIRFGVMADALRMGRRQMTVLAANRQRLLIETVGPFGTASHDFAAHELLRVDVLRAAVRDRHDRLHPVWHLRLALREREIPLLPGRNAQELHWIANALRSRLVTREKSTAPS